MATCKGKSTRPLSPVVTKNELIELPPELVTAGKKIELVIDLVFINSASFLQSVYHTLKFNSMVALALGTITKGESYTSEVL